MPLAKYLWVSVSLTEARQVVGLMYVVASLGQISRVRPVAKLDAYHWVEGASQATAFITYTQSVL